MNTTIRRNGNVELNGEHIGTITRHQFGAWVSPAVNGRPARLHDTRKAAAETLVTEHQDAQDKATPGTGWVERYGVLWVAYDADGQRVGGLHNTRREARQALATHEA